MVAGAIAVVVIVGLSAVIGIWYTSRPSALDRFYQPPPDEEVAAAARGDIFREETIDNGGTGAVAYRVLYRTVGLDGAPLAASGFIAWPSETAPPGGYPIVAFGHSTVGLADKCAPSRGGFGIVNRSQVIAFLEAGYAVASADYPGLGPPGPHPYLAGEASGNSVIDIVRAARQSAGDQLSDKVVAWGYSQGGHAVLWARALVAEAAPELDWRGTIALAPVVDLAVLARSDALGDVLGVAVAMGREPTGLEIDPLLTDAGRQSRDDLESECINRVIEAAVERGEPVLADTQAAWIDDLADEAPPVEGTGPAWVLYGDEDTTVGSEAVAAWVERGAGSGVTGRVFPGFDHGGLVEAAGDDVLAWMLERLAPA